jgi:hypothetical protein
MASFLATLKEWQSLAGAIVSGVISLCVALLVASHARRASERSSAMLLIGDLSAVMAMVKSGNAYADENRIPDDRRMRFLANSFVDHRPRLSPLIDAAASQVRNCEVNLAATLAHLTLFLRDIEAIAERIEEDRRTVSATQAPRPPLLQEADLGMLVSKFGSVSLEAEFSINLLQRYVLSRFPIWHKLRRRLLGPTGWERDGIEALKRGDFA